MPMISLIIFLWLGFGADLWHPGWMVFLLVPIVNIIVEKRIRPRKMVGIVITATYIAIGLLTDEWHPTWIIFLLIPIINTIFFPQKHAFIEFGTETVKSRFKNFIIEEEKDDEDRE
jgi:general stress protein CsbA